MASSGRLSLEEQLRLAEANYAKSVQQRHDVIAKDYGSVDKMPVFPCRLGPPGEENKYWEITRNRYTIWDFTPPAFYPPVELERVGRLGDGGKWVTGMSKLSAHPGPFVVYSLGIGDDSSWENEMLTRTRAEIWGYDFSVDGFILNDVDPAHHHRLRFNKVGVAGKTDTTRSPPWYSLQDLMAQNGHDYIDLLKVDIETHEFEVFNSFVKAFPGVLPIGQLLVEVHLEDPTEVFYRKEPRWKSTSQSYLEWYERLEAGGLRQVSMDFNNIAITLTGAGEKAGGPILNELAFINVKDKKSIILDGVTV